ncbi:MAG: hypothetical protein R2827_14850 [Bdellovibrionales bacterium]
MRPIKSVFQCSGDWADRENISHDSFATIGSTNDHAKSISLSADFYDQPKIILANEQTHGRGRGSHHWVSAPVNSALFSSWIFDLHKPPQPITSPLIGLATYEALKKTWPDIRFSIKAPNDIYVGSKKLSGLLIETIQKGTHHRLIVGLGMNVLENPEGVNEATHLLEHMNSFLLVDQWESFLNELNKNFKNQLKLIILPELEMADRILLKKALSACPLYTSPLKEVSPNGDLIFDNGTQSWHDL